MEKKRGRPAIMCVRCVVTCQMASGPMPVQYVLLPKTNLWNLDKEEQR